MSSGTDGASRWKRSKPAWCRNDDVRDPHIGCPVEWLKRVLRLVNTKEQLAVAIWLHRRRVVCHNEPFTVPNKALREDLGLSRQVKYATLRRLEEAGAIALLRDGKHTLQVRLLG